MFPAITKTTKVISLEALISINRIIDKETRHALMRKKVYIVGKVSVLVSESV